MSKKERLIMAFSIVAGFTCAQYLIKIFIRDTEPNRHPDVVSRICDIILGWLSDFYGNRWIVEMDLSKKRKINIQVSR